jgi:hypothetical protein
MSEQEKNQRKDSENFSLSENNDIDITTLIFDGRDDRTKMLNDLNDIFEEMPELPELPDIELSSLREDSKRKIWVETRDPRYEKGVNRDTTI